jgi:hypothetical protein
VAVDQGPCPVQLTDLAIYQTLRVPLVEAGEPAAGRTLDVVEGKAGLARASLAPTDPAAPPVAVHARLTVTSAAGSQTLEDTRTIGAPSSEGDLGSTLDFALDAGLVRADSTLAVDVLEPAACRSKPQQGRLPHQGAVALAPRKTGVLKVVLVPVRYDADGSGRLPDTSDMQIDRIRSAMLALYPVASVDVTLRAVVGSTVDLAGSSSAGWSQFLDSMRGLRASDKAPDDVYYYGLVEPAGTLSGYCRNTCIAGISFQVSENRPALRAGVGLAFPGETTATTLAHEIGHQHGRGHSPCGATAGLDPAYPYPNGVTGTWGFDSRNGTLIAPSRRDIMGYCMPLWISDYTYQALLERSAIINPALAAEIAPPRLASGAGELASPEPAAGGFGDPLRVPITTADFDVLLVGADGSAQRGQPLSGFAPPADTVREAADLLGATGERMGSIDVYRLPIADVDVTMVLVPRMPTGARALVLPGMARPLRFDEMATPAKLLP